MSETDTIRALKDEIGALQRELHETRADRDYYYSRAEKYRDAWLAALQGEREDEAQ